MPHARSKARPPGPRRGEGLPPFYNVDDPRHRYAIAYFRWLATDPRVRKPTAKEWDCPARDARQVLEARGGPVRRAGASLLMKGK